MPRRPDFRALPKHPAIVSDLYLGRYLGRSRVMVHIRCPRCNKVRERTGTETRREMQRPNFRGLCRGCSIASVKDGTHRWFNYQRKPKTHFVDGRGYVTVSPQEVPDNLLPMYREMQTSGQPVLGHRWAVAQHLGRALKTHEMIDHMNGIKTDNSLENLRIYLHGKNQPGSSKGYGTYYHEWQMAEARIKELEAKLA